MNTVTRWFVILLLFVLMLAWNYLAAQTQTSVYFNCQDGICYIEEAKLMEFMKAVQAILAKRECSSI